MFSVPTGENGQMQQNPGPAIPPTAERKSMLSPLVDSDMARPGEMLAPGTRAEETSPKRHGERAHSSVLVEAIQYVAVGENMNLPHACKVGTPTREATGTF